jgi:ElaB/YqjD/DUF883 family membrane-anchored ribosome-binding protein
MNIRSNAASTAEEITAIQELMNDLEKRLRRLSGETSREFTGGSAEISDFVSDTLTGIKERVRAGVHSVSQAATDKNAHLGSDALKKVTGEMERHPLTMLAIATGIGFIFGMSRR